MRRGLQYIILPVFVVLIFGCSTYPRRQKAGLSGKGRIADAETFDSGNVTIAPWFDFKNAACSITFDDGTLDQYILALPELEKRNLKATFFVITGYRDRGFWYDFDTKRLLFSWDHAREMTEVGHEIGSHSRFHTDLTKYTPHIEEDLAGSFLKINYELSSQGYSTFSWPFWRSNLLGRSIAKRYYISARGGTTAGNYIRKNGGIPLYSPEDLFRVNSFGLMRDDTDQLWKKVCDRVFSEKGWFVVGFHGIDDGTINREALGWEPLPINRFRTALDYLQAKGFWIAPFGSVSRYIKERDSSVISVKYFSDSSLIISIDDQLDDLKYNQELSVRVKLPESWRKPTIYHYLKSVNYISRGNYVIFNILPDGSNILIVKGEV